MPGVWTGQGAKMADRALTPEAVLTGLQDIRLPAEAAGGLVAEVLAVVGLGLGLALLLGLAVRIVSRPRVSRTRVPSLASRLAALSDLPEAERSVALLHLLKEVRPARYQALSEGIYRIGGVPDASALEAELRRHD